jgi:hypothetical protein
MEVSGQLHAPAALPPEKKPPEPIGQNARWAPEPVWRLGRREKRFLCRESNPCIIHLHSTTSCGTSGVVNKLWLK